MKDITAFIQERLYAVTYSYIPSIFPEMEFQEGKNEWRSPKNIDGSTPQHPRKDKTIITQRIPTRAIEHGEGGSKDIIDLYKYLNNCNTYEAIEAICGIVGLEIPSQDPEESERWKRYKERQDRYEVSLARQRAALFLPEGKAVLDYLHSRGWNDYEIKEAELGYISEAEARTIDAQKGIGKDYVLSIPLRSSGHIYGFKFRYISEDCYPAKKGMGKYRYLEGCKREFYGLTGIQQTNGEIVVVEGELDALHGMVKGIPNLVATSGNGLTDELIGAAKKKGISFITLLLDSDTAGARFTRESINAAYRSGLQCLVAVLPKETKDVDEYLSKHSVEELTAIINTATPSSFYLYNELLDKYTRSQNENEDVTPITEKEYLKLRDDIINLLLETPDHEERNRIIADFCERTGNVISQETLQERADLRQMEADKVRQSKQTADTIRTADRLQKNGQTLEAIKLMGEAYHNLVSLDKRAKYNHLLTLPSRSQIADRVKNKQKEIATQYDFRSLTGETETFTLPSGAITFICAPTSHGKSTMLQNIALQVASNTDEGDTLYFTFEEDGDSVLLQMINKYVNRELCRNYDARKSNNLRAIAHYWRTGDDHFISSSERTQFHQREDYFLSNFIENGKLRIYYEDYDSSELIEAIEAIGKQRKIKAVFIDYIQLLNKRGCKLQRNEELKEICKDFKNLAIRTQLPIIVAAQLNREAKSPIEMFSQNIAEASDLERIANKILCMWNSSFPSQRNGDSKKELEEFQKRTTFTLGEPGKIYAKLTKNRGGIVGIESILEFNGNTGVIEAPSYGTLSFGRPL